MLSSLQDISGLIPGLFQRGQPAAEGAGRGQGGQVQPQVDGGRHGADRLSLSPEAQSAEPEDGAGSTGDAAVAEADGGSALGQAGGMIRKALQAIRHDLSKALKAFGFDSAAVENFTKAFVEPVLSALKEGVNFTAELTFAAFSQVTTTSSNGDFSQSTSLVAQSLEIAVNHDTGEVSVSLAKLSFLQQIESTGGSGGDGQSPLLVIDPDDLASPQELAAKILEGGETAATAPQDDVPAPVEGAEDTAEETAEEASDATSAPDAALNEKLAELRERLAEDADRLQTRLTIYSVSTYKNDKGETITKLLLDAQLNVARLTEDATAQEEAQSLDVTA